MKQMKFVLNFLISLALMLTLIALQFSLFTRMKLLNSDFYSSVFQKNNLYSYTKQNTENKLTNLGRVVNLPNDIFQGIITDEWTKHQIDDATSQTVQYMTYKSNKLPIVDVKPITDKFNLNLDNYIKSSNLKVDKTVEKELTKIKSDTGSIIKNEATIVNLSLLEKNSSFQNARKLLYYIHNSTLAIAAAIMVLAFLLFLLNYKASLSFINWIGYSLISSGFLILILSLIGLLSKFINNIAIGDTVLKNIVINIFNSSLSFLIVMSTIYIIIGVIFNFSIFKTSNRQSI